MGPALLSNCYKLSWQDCADLPSALCFASAALHDNKAYVMAGKAPEDDTYHFVYVYDINSNQWDRLPPPGQHKGKLQIIDSKLTVIGGVDNVTKELTDKVTTFNKNQWTKCYPNLLRARVGHGTVSHLDYVIVAGGELEDTFHGDDIEVLNYKQSSHWVKARMELPYCTLYPALTISDNQLYIIDSSSTIYKVPVNTVISSATKITSNQSGNLIKVEDNLNSYDTIAVVPNSSPPVILGSDDSKTDVIILDVANNCWKIIQNITDDTNRSSTTAFAIVPIHRDSILCIGGCTAPNTAKIHSVTKVERGSLMLDYITATVGLEPNVELHCVIL